jgi:hypothetical protein
MAEATPAWARGIPETASPVSVPEATWNTKQPRTFDDYVAAGVGGLEWQRGTRWLGGLPEATITDLGYCHSNG